MPGKVKVRIVSGRNLPIMDRSNLTTDAYVEVKLGSTVFKTDVYRKSLNPIWNSEWFRFEMDDLELQDEPLQIRLMDHDTYSSNDAIGKVYLDLNPLLCNSSRGKDTSGKMISGWIPVYDTMHGIRGEVNLIVKVELFSDLNKFRQSSCGVRFFFTQSVPEGYIAHIMQGFVEELVVNDDPEYQWIDKIRTPRASNEARQTLFSKLSGEVQRRVGLKALELGGNSVIGYKQCFDLEGESGIVVRGIGTAAYLTKQYENQLSPTCGESLLGLTREFAELQGYRSLSKYGRSFRRRGGPGRAPRLHRRSFRMPSSSDSVSELHQQYNEDHRCDDACRLMVPAHTPVNFQVGADLVVESSSGGVKGVVKLGSSSYEQRFKERSSSFREDSITKLVKLKKSLTASARSVQTARNLRNSSGANKDNLRTADSTDSSRSAPDNQSSCPGSLLRSGKGDKGYPPLTSVTFPVPLTTSQQTASRTSQSTPAFQKCSTGISPHISHSPLCKSRRVAMERSPAKVVNTNCNSDYSVDSSFDVTPHTSRRDEKYIIRSTFDEPCYRSRSALASCMMHNRTYSETMRPALSNQAVRNEHLSSKTISKSVNELNTTDSINILGKTGQLLDYLGSGGEFESAGSNIDSNEDSTSDTSMRYIYEGGPFPHPRCGNRLKREVEFESDTSKEFTKMSSGNEACSVENEDLSPVSERGYLLLRKKRGSRRKDRFSKTSLMKRASANFAERGSYFFGGTDKIREEVVKFFKRKKSSDDNESCSSSTKNASTTSTVKKCSKTKSSPYRETKFFFRRRRTCSTNAANKGLPINIYNNPLALGRRSRSFGQLFRSNSDSHSVGQTSLDSMPSVGSEPLFDPEDDDSSHAELNINLSTKSTEIYREKITTTSLIPIPNLNIPEDDEEEKDNGMEGDDANTCGMGPPSPNIIQLARNEVVEIIEELGYSTESPINLYISSMDALLVFDPSSKEASPSLTASAGGSNKLPSACSPSASAKQSARINKETCSSSSNNTARDFKTSECANCSRNTAPLRYVNNSAASEIGARGSLGQCDNFGPLSKMSEKINKPSSQSHNDEDSTKFSNFSETDGVTSQQEKSLKQIPIHRDAPSNSSSSITRDKCNTSPYDFLPVTVEEEHIVVYRTSNSSAIMKDSDNTNFGDDEEILVVVSSTSNRGPGGLGVDTTCQRSADGGKIDEKLVQGRNDDNEQKPIFGLHDNTEAMGITRSPIPEEFLSDRATPTALSNTTQIYQNNTILTGGVSTTNTNTLSSHQAQSSTSTSLNNGNLINSDNSHGPNLPAAPQGRLLTMNNSTELTSCNNNDTMSVLTAAPTNKNGTGGGVGSGNIASSKRFVASHSTEETSSVVRNDNESAAAPSDESVVPKTSLTTATPSPSSRPACDPQHYHCQAYGCPINHRLQQLHQQQGIKESYSGFSQEMSIDAEAADIGDDGGNVQGNGKVLAKPIQKTPTYNIGHQIPKIPFGGPSPHNHTNMTTTIITSGTGTIPMVMGGGNSLHRRSSESDLSTPPKPTIAAAHMRNYPNTVALKGGIAAAVDQYGLMEYPFITISQFPPGFLTHIGGTVTARSVKLLERISNLDEPESRDAWWNEIRMEIRAHCRAFGCTVVVGYEEHTTMCDDVCVLSASGTAAIAATTIGLKNVELLTVSTKHGAANPKIANTPCPGRGVEKDRAVLAKVESVITNAANNGGLKHMLGTPSKLRHDSDLDYNCTLLHIPSNPSTLPLPVKMSRCQVCRKGRVPDVLIVTVDIPPGLHLTGRGTLIQAQVFRPKRDCKGETSAKEVSDSLPFLEYELHRRLINKLKVKGMNAIFGLKVQICLGDKLMVALATGTAVYITALPPPGVPIITAGNLKTDAQKVLQYQKVVQEAYDKNRQHYDLKNIFLPTNNGRLSGSSGEDSEEDDSPEIQNSTKDTYILEVDDAEDIDIISMLIDPHPSSEFFVNNTDYLHGYEEHHVTSQQMFTQIWRCRIPTLSLRQFTAYFERLIRSVCFKLRKMLPCVLSKLSFRVDIPEQDEMQIALYGLAMGMADQTKAASVERSSSGKLESVPSVGKEEGDLIFPLEDDGQNLTGKLAEVITALNDGSLLKELQRGIAPTSSGILIPATSQIQSVSGVVQSSRNLSQQPVIISPSPHILANSQIGGNGSSQKVNGSGPAAPCPAVAPLLSKFISGDPAAVPIAGNFASSSNSVSSGHGPNYSFRGAAYSQHPMSFSRSGSKVIKKSVLQSGPRPRFTVEITPLSYIPGAKIEKYLGNLNFFFIRETTSIRENGGLSGFVHTFVAEVLAIVRAHVGALGGNAMVSYFMTELSLLHNPHKNQGQCLINVGGDVVLIVHPLPASEETQFGS